MKYKRIPSFDDLTEFLEQTECIHAPMDGKNTSTDWIEEIFDDSNCCARTLGKKNEFLGFIQGHIAKLTYRFGQNDTRISFLEKEAKEDYLIIFDKICEFFDTDNTTDDEYTHTAMVVADDDGDCINIHFYFVKK